MEQRATEYWLRRVESDHLNFSELTESFEDGRQTLMNFSKNYLHQAQDIANGAKMLVWVRQFGKFWAAIEIVGTVDDGARACVAHGFRPGDGRHGETWGQIYRPITFTRKFATPDRGPTLAETAERSGVPIRRLQHSMQRLPEAHFTAIFDAIDWNSESRQPSPYVAPQVTAIGRKTDESPQYILPDFPGASQLLSRLQQSRGLPERNMEDLVRELLVALGHFPTSIVFQVGRIDVLLNTNGNPAFVFEVKRTLDVRGALDQARRQGFDYAGKTGARFVVLTDADTYEIYDRTRGLDHGSMKLGRFTLSRFRPEDDSLLSILRHPSAQATHRP